MHINVLRCMGASWEGENPRTQRDSERDNHFFIREKEIGDAGILQGCGLLGELIGLKDTQWLA